MIKPEKRETESIMLVEKELDGLVLTSAHGKMKLQPKADGIVRIIFTRESEFSHEEKPGVVNTELLTDWYFEETEREIRLCTCILELVIQKQSLSIQYYDKQGRLLLREREQYSKALDPFEVYKPIYSEDAEIKTIQTPDGEKRILEGASKKLDRTLYHTRLHMNWQPDEALYGLGQHEEGNLNLRGHTVYVHQANMKIAVPLLVSSLGYGILMDTYSPMVFHDDEFGSYLYTEADTELDYYFLYGGNMDGVISAYRFLTGKATMLPRWAFGFIQSQERYESSEELLETVKKFREREIGIDCIVLDWCSWRDQLWGEKELDPERFPDPEGLLCELHRQNVHLMVSIWPNVDEKSQQHRQLKDEGMLLPFSNIYNALEQKGRDIYWQQAYNGFFRYDVDAWWCDSSEPFTPEWNHEEKPEPPVMYQEYTDTAGQHMPLQLSNAYSLYHGRAIFEGQRGTTKEKRVINLTRSGYTGQQRYGTVLWSGDISASWETLSRQIAAGLSLCASGMPYWTLDIGGFFTKRGRQWYWNGEYEKGCEDLTFRELYVRWYQYGCFLPMFRAHGTDTRRELWHYGEKDSDTYKALLKMNRLRYQLLPYIYSAAGEVWLKDYTMMRMLAFDFPGDAVALQVRDQYMFGQSLLVCPVTVAMYSTENGQSNPSKKTRTVYLPEGVDWYNFWTGQRYAGGQYMEAEAPLDIIPVFVRAGSILPVGEPLHYADEQKEKPLQLRIYPGRDAEYLFYEDQGDGYGYEEGEYQITDMRWKEDEKRFSATRDGISVEHEYNILSKRELFR